MLVGIDIGGTLTKVSIFDTLGDRPEQEVIETLGLSRSLLVTSHTIQQQNLDTFSSTTNGLYKKIHIILIETQKIPEIIDILVEKLSALKHNNGENTINDLLEREVGTNGLRITLTGGGAYKYKKLIDEKLTPLLNDTVGHYVNSNNNNSENVIVGGVDEVQALVFWADLSIASGTTTTNIPSDQIKSELGTFTYKDRDISELPGPSNIHIDQSTDATRSITDSKSFQLLASLELVPQTSDAGSEIYPYILCNVGTGVSILLVKDKDNYQRISGSGLGGGAFWGLCQLMTKYTNFDEAIVDSFLGLGDADKCDALVR
ncbi:Pantothenate kinase 1 [Mycoemilia scoparia]|uniref:Pantothenate kinase 1 n=1 Tax=Mycoemilia scoparia TaxID=417184 RepID=A0A9W8DV47_9FUNG|nr:Pantothenate kinase 1 [Mycoemilia scoparia]